MASVAMQMHLNILQQDQVWTSRRNDYSEHDVIIVLGVDSTLLCKWPEVVPDQWETPEVDTSTEVGQGSDVSFEKSTPASLKMLEHGLGGRPCVWDLKHEYPVDLGSPSHSDTESEELSRMYVVAKPLKRGKQTPDTSCPDCDFVAVKGADLYHHIKGSHPEVHSYACWDCKKNFQTDHDRLNHMNVIHRSKGYHCTVCAYTAVTEARIQDHIRTHATKKYECTTCEAKLATQAALRKHTSLHLSKEEIECDVCHKNYASKLALSVHKHGKHGQGYQCSCCEAMFDALIKKA